jgi:hypothetical protein
MSDHTHDLTTDVPICEHHRDGDADPYLARDPMLPPDWRVAECPICGYACEVNPTTGEVRTA